ncbi:MAG: BolA family protein [Sedimenticola sp.]
MMKEQEIIERVRELYPDAIIDVAGEDCSFELYIVSNAFKELNTLQRQKPVLALFKEEIRTGALHALTIKAKTPDELNSASGLVQLTL